MIEKKIDYSEDNKILSVKNLQVNFKSDNGLVHAVRGVSFDLYRGETLCIVGESGSGKSVTSKSIMGILPGNSIIADGQIIYEGEDLVRVSEEDFHRIRGNKIGMIFQDPLSALNPIVKVGKQIIETSMINNNILKKRYNDLISNDLTAFVNIKANEDYEILKINEQITDNKKMIKEYGKIESNLSKNSKKKVFLENRKAEIEGKVEVYTNSIIRNFDVDINALNERIERNNLREKELEKLNGKSNDGVPVNLRIQKRRLRNSGLQREIENIQNFKDKKMPSAICERLSFINCYLDEKIKIVKDESKEQKPVLKEILNLRKKMAKIEVEKYKEEITHSHDEEVNKVKVELDKAEKEFANYKDSFKTKLDEYCGTLDSNDVRKYTSICKNNIELLNGDFNLDITKLKGYVSTNDKKFEDLYYQHEIIEECNLAVKENIKISRLIKKEKTKFKENNVSKTTNDEIKLVPIIDKKYNDYFNSIENYKGRISQLDEEFINKTKITKKEAKKKALEVMREVGIPLPERRFNQYPFEFSGGMRQRIVIAIALTADPEILICDEPTTALDVTIQAQILELINKLKVERNLSCIFITHDLGVVANMADRVAVMYAGKIVEYGLAKEVFFDPRHPYTWALLSSIPDIDSKERLEAIPGTPPDMIYPPKGDAFALRSKYAMNIDFKYEPPYFKVSDTHYAATWLLYPSAPKVEMPKIVKTRISNALKNEEERLKKEKEVM